MLNSNLLRGTIISRGSSIADLAEALNVDKSTLYRKVGGYGSFTVDEIDAMAAALGLTANEIIAIFFGQEVAEMRHQEGPEGGDSER